MPLTAGWSKHNYFNKVWQKALAQTLHTTHNCTIRVTVTDENAVEDFDPATGETIYDPRATTILYEGTARVQPRGASFEKNNQAADTSVRRVQFQLPLRGLADINLDVSGGVVLEDNEPIAKSDTVPSNLTVEDDTPIYRDGVDTHAVTMDDGEPIAVPRFGPKDTGGIRPGSIIRVLECELYPEMTTLDYRTQGIVNSGNPIEITLYAMVDQEVIVGD